MSDVVPIATRRVFQAASLCTLFAVALGSVVCATESGFECGNWPGCTDSTLLPGGPISTALYRNPWIEMTHRVSAVLAGPLALVAGLLVLRIRRASLLVKVLPWVTVAGAMVAGIFGRMTVLGLPIPAWGGATDLSSALLAMVAMLVATIGLDRTPAVVQVTRTAQLAWGALATLWAMHVVSLFAAGAGSYTRCLSWPVWELLSADHQTPVVLAYLRFALALGATLLIVAAIRQAWSRSSERSVVIAVSVLLGLVLGCGVVIRLTATDDLGVPYSLATVGLLWALTLLAGRSTLRTSVSAPARSLVHH